MQCKSLSAGSDPPTAGRYVSAVAVARRDGARSGGSELGTDRSAGNLGKYSEQQCKGPPGRGCSINIYNGIEVGGGGWKAKAKAVAGSSDSDMGRIIYCSSSDIV
jgi:hypothetical protein